MKILIIRLSAIGDIIHSLPVAAAIKHEIPQAKITWLSEPLGVPLLQNNPVIDKVLVLPKKIAVGSIFSPGRWLKSIKALLAIFFALLTDKFDAVIDLQGLLKSGIWVGLSRAPLKIGFAAAREGSHFFLNERVDVGDYFHSNRHIVDLNLKIVEYLSQKSAKRVGETISMQARAVEFPLPQPPEYSINKIEKLLQFGYDFETHRLSDAASNVVRNVVLIPGTTWPSKIWPGENWVKLAKLLASKLNMQVCLIGGVKDSAINSQIENKLKEESPLSKVLNLTGQTSLLDLIALYKRVDLVIGADTGPLHLAAACGKPKVVGIFGSTPSKRNGPYGQQCLTINLNLWCQPCFEKVCPLSTTACLQELTPDQVMSEVNLFLNK